MIHWIKFILITALIVWITVMFAKICNAGIEFVNYYDKQCFAYRQKILLIETAKDLAEMRDAMVDVKEEIAKEKDKLFQEALKVLDEAMSEADLFDLYERRKEIASQAKYVIDEVRGKFGTAGANMYFGSEVIEVLP